MAHTGIHRLAWAAAGAGIALAAVWVWPDAPAPEPSEREERIARDLRIAREVERDHTKLRLAEAEERRALWEAQEQRRREAILEGPAAPRRPKHKTMRPTTLHDLVGHWTDDDDHGISLLLFSNGVYIYGGWPGEYIERAQGVRRRPGYAQPHGGTWTWKDNVLRLEPDHAMRGTQITFSWESREAAVRARFLGVAPSHINTVLLRKVIEGR